MDAAKEHEATKLAEHIARIRTHKRQFAPLRPFIHSSLVDFVLPLAFRHKVDTVAQQQQWNPRLANDYQTSQPELWDAVVRSTPQFAALHRVLTELYVRLPWLEARRLLDVGFGAGVGPWAVREVWGFDAVDEYVAVEGNSRMQQLGRAMTDNIEWRIKHLQRLNQPMLDELRQSSSSGAKRPPTRGAMDVVLSAYGLSRVGKDRRREQLDVMWRSVRRSGVLVIVEDGTKEGFEVVRAAREYLLQRYTLKSKGSSAPQPAATESTGQSTAPHSASDSSHPFLFSLPSPPSAASASVSASTPIVLAPCGHDASCPQGKEGVCSFGRRILTASLPHSSPYRALKSDGELGGLLIDRFSYVVLHKGAITPPATVSSDARTAEAVVERVEAAAAEYEAEERDELEMGGEQQEEQRLSEQDEGEGVLEDETEYADDSMGAQLDATTTANVASSLPLPAAFYSGRYHRVMSPPLLRSKHVTLDLCTTDAQLQRWTIPKSAGLEGGYTQARDTRWGDLWNRPKAVSSTSRRKEERRKRDKEAGAATRVVGQAEKASVQESREVRSSARTTSAGGVSSSETAAASMKLGAPVHDWLIAARQAELDEKRAKRKARQQSRSAAAPAAAGVTGDSATVRMGSEAKRSSSRRGGLRGATEAEEEEEMEVANEAEEEEEDDDEDADYEEEEEEPDRNTIRG